MHQNKSDVQSSKTSLYQKNIDNKSSLDSQIKHNDLKKEEANKNLFSANKIDSKLLMKLMKNLSNIQLEKKDKEVQKEQKIEQQDENMYKKIKNSDKILKGVLKLNLIKNYTVGYNHNTLEKCQLILQNYRYRKIRAARIQKSIYKIVLIYYNKFFDLVTQIQIRQNAMLNFAEFLYKFFANKNKQFKQEFFNGYQRLNKAFNIYEFQRNKDLDNWKEGCFDILKDYDRQPKSMMSLLDNNSNYFKFLTFYDYFQRLQVKNNQKEYLQDFFDIIKGDYQKTKNKKESVKKLITFFKKNNKKNLQESFNIIHNKKSKLQTQFLIQSVYLVKLNKLKNAFDNIKKQSQKIQKKKTQSELSQSPELKGTQTRYETQKNMGNVNILNIPKRKKLDLEAFIKYVEYLKFLREKHAFYKILSSIKNPKEERVIHGRISILKRPIEYEQWTDQYQQFIQQNQQDPEVSSNWMRQDSINHAINQRNVGFGHLHQSQINLNQTSQSVQDFRQLRKKFSQTDLRQRVKQRGQRPPPPDTLESDGFQRAQTNLNQSGYIVRKKQKWTKKYQPSYIQEDEFNNVQDVYTQNRVTQSTANFYPQQQPENQQNKHNLVTKFTKTFKKTKNGQVVKKTTKRTTTKRSYVK